MVNVDKFLGIANKEKRKYELNDDYCAMISMLRKIDGKLYVVVPFVRSDDKVWKKGSGIVPEYYSVIDPKEMKLLEFNKTTEKNFVIKDIKKNNDYAILLQLCKKANCYLLKENLAEYRIRKKSISHDKLMKKLKSHYDLFHSCDGKQAIIAFWYACWNMWYGVIKKLKYERNF